MSSIRSSFVHLLLVAACGGSPKSQPQAPPDLLVVKHEHWEDVDDRRYVNADACGMGPFELTLPAREDDRRFEYGRRIVLFVYGPRTLDLDSRFDASVQTSMAFGGEEIAAEHVECRVGDGVPVGRVSVRAEPSKPGKPTTPGQRPRGPMPHAMRALDTPSEELPPLEPFTGPLPGSPRQAGSIAFLPKGNPFYYADELWTTRLDDSASAAVRLRFWTRAPSDLRGIVFRFVEQRLVPDAPEPAYGAEFAARVAHTKQRREDDRPAARAKAKQQEQYCKAFAEERACARNDRVYARIPPPPMAETRPKTPSPDAVWISGAWTWDDAVGDFTWVGGTYVIRPKPVVAAAAPEPVAPAPEPPAPEPPRDLDTKVTEAPAPKIEAIPPPPPASTVWIAGHWALVGTQWTWNAGRWVVGQPGLRFRAPVVRSRGAVRVYVPGGWIRLR